MTPAVFTIPPHRAFADALAAGIMAAHGSDPLGLARGTILLPNNRAVRAVTDAFVRRTGTGLLLPRLVPIGDPELDDRIGGAFDPAIGDPAHGEPIPTAIDPMLRRMMLARLVQEQSAEALGPAEAMRLGVDLSRTLDALLVEEVDPRALADEETVASELSVHWQSSLDKLQVILDAWPKRLRELGCIDLADRRNRLINALSRRWRDTPPAGFVVAAGITATASASARLSGVLARLPLGQVVLPGVDLAMTSAEWDALGPHEPDPDTGIRRRSIETHPQFHLKLLLDRMAVGRGEVRTWRYGSGNLPVLSDVDRRRRWAPAVRTRAIGNAMAPARFTGKWQDLPPAERRLTGVRGVEAAGPAEEAQVIALALREALEEPGRTAALVTPDRMLARRVQAHLRRWDIAADDSAGRPLSQTPPGTLLLALATAAAQRFAPVALVALLKHPLVRQGEARLAWLDGARALDEALRGPRPAAGLAGVDAHLAKDDERGARVHARAAAWWPEARLCLELLEYIIQPPTPFGLSLSKACPSSERVESAGLRQAQPERVEEFGFSQMLAALRQTATALCGDAIWSGPAGREAASLIADAEAAAEHGPRGVTGDSLVPLLAQLLGERDVRPPYGGHPRIFIWGLIEARLQSADMTIVAGLNEGTWPQLPQPDAWLAPRIRHNLGLPGLERRIGIAAHDFASALGGRRVLVTRARRDARAPAIASRFWLRLEAMTAGLTRAPALLAWARALDEPGYAPRPAERPAPAVPRDARPTTISVTEVDRLKADPYAFYARSILRLSPFDLLDADPGPAWRGSAVHGVLEDWMTQDDCAPDALRDRAETLLAAAHPLLRTLWRPRLLEAVDKMATLIAQNRATGRQPHRAEVSGRLLVDGVTLKGRADRIDRDADGALTIVDYKTGAPPSGKQVNAGFALQLGLLGLIAQEGGFPDLDAGTPQFPGVGRGPASEADERLGPDLRRGTTIVTGFEYWSLARGKDRGFGYVKSPLKDLDAADFIDRARRDFAGAAARWLTGNEPFTAKLRPDLAPYTEYDQLMRLDEWYGRETEGR